MATFDLFLADHIARNGNKGRRHASYLSSTIFDEFVEVLTAQVRSVIIEEVKEAKYYSMSVDSTPDITHTDQLTFILRYINKAGLPVERFIAFIPIEAHDTESLTSEILTALDKFGMELRNCCGQSYDNASNMAGCLSGVQARIKEMNPKASFVPCSAHSLNLVGV
ncbi:52 kDa repressor of the inhibitor of the protein kinase-like [Aplysia californica]|uniref:52 kDa repressor of the inhibitor of the protein kinase-like n=1 Tax=Aplysia californica TaxID=6500 RepID=A0ABM1A1W1_APLCA|nr:52 kDa repressor of the inhibitor of the protein kinase-like [Aplysia californica]